MFTNMKQEFINSLALPVAARMATTPGSAIDCEPPAVSDSQKEVDKKYRLVYFTIMVGTIGDGVHTVTVEQSADGANWAGTGVTTGALAQDSVSTLALRRDPNAGRFVRLVHNVTGPNVQQGAVVGGVAHRARVPAAAELNLEQVLRHCVYALGAGAGMPIESDALERVTLHVRDAFFATLHRGGNPAQEWRNVRYFLLTCCEEIGRRAAQYARDNAKIAIPFTVPGVLPSNKGLKHAYNEVSAANTGAAAGDYCPVIP
jgi:hypothetical protein